MVAINQIPSMLINIFDTLQIISAIIESAVYFSIKNIIFLKTFWSLHL